MTFIQAQFERNSNELCNPNTVTNLNTQDTLIEHTDMPGMYPMHRHLKEWQGQYQQLPLQRALQVNARTARPANPCVACFNYRGG